MATEPGLDACRGCITPSAACAITTSTTTTTKARVAWAALVLAPVLPLEAALDVACRLHAFPMRRASSCAALDARSSMAALHGFHLGLAHCLCISVPATTTPYAALDAACCGVLVLAVGARGVGHLLLPRLARLLLLLLLLLLAPPCGGAQALARGVAAVPCLDPRCGSSACFTGGPFFAGGVP